MIRSSLFLGCFGMIGAVIPALASELFYMDDHFGSVWRLETETLANELILHGSDIPHSISSGPRALGFRSPEVLFISPDGPSNYYSGLHHYAYDGEELVRISTRHSFTNGWRLHGGTRGHDGRTYFAALYGDTLWSFGSDVYAQNADGTSYNTGPGEEFIATTGSYPRFVAYSWLDRRIAVSHGTGVRIYRSDGDAVVHERTIDIAGINQVKGIAFDRDGLVVADGEGKEIGRKSLLYISDANTASILRYDATTGEPYGTNEDDRSDPVFIGRGTGGIEHIGNFAIDPSDGHVYVSNGNGNYRDQYGYPRWVISRFSRTGNVLNDNLAFTYPNIRSMSFRPTVQQVEVEENGEYVLGPAGIAVREDAAGLWLKSAMAVQQALVDFYGLDFVGELSIGGTESGGIIARLNDGESLKTIRIDINRDGALEVQADANLLVEAGLRIDGGRLEAGPGSRVEVGPGSQLVDGAGASIISTGGGNISAGGGSIISTGGGNIITTGGGNIISAGGGNLQLQGGGSLIGHAGGNIRAGYSPGVFNLIGGSVELQAGSTVEVELGGLLQGEEYDFYDFQTDPDGNVHIDGNLVVLLIDGFAGVVTNEDAFTVVRAAVPITGTIGNLSPGSRVSCADGTGSFRVSFAEEGKAIVLDDYQSATLRESWYGRYFTAAEQADLSVSGDSSDPDSDGWANLVEFALDLDPRQANRSTVCSLTMNTEAGTLAFAYRRRTGGMGTAVDYVAEGTRYRLEVSADLVDWQPVTAPAVADAVAIEPDESGSLEEVVIEIPVAEGEARHFYRLHLERT